jgi:hypothetical protein
MLAYLIAGCFVPLGSWWVLARLSRRLRGEFQTEIGRLSKTIRALENKLSSQNSGNGNPSQAANIRIIAAKSKEHLRGSLGSDHAVSISSKTEEAITATLSAFLGQKVQIRSIKLLENHDLSVPWVTQGRIAIQASHNQFVSHE